MDIASLGIAGVAAITVICFLAAEAAKSIKLDERFLPVICGVLGGILGVVGMLCMGDFPANDVITAIAVGIVSGLAATGAHQIYKQFTK
jgi:ribonucleotide monophosphatase NagD (HAD superfamily)